MDKMVLKELLLDLIRTMRGKEDQSASVNVADEVEDTMENASNDHGEGCECPECKMGAGKPAASMTIVEEIGMKPRKKV
jgi:hypothetical protein